MASPTVDGSAINQTWPGGTSSATVTLTTTQTNDVILVGVATENNTGALRTVSSISSTSGLAFTQRSHANTPAGAVGIETWQAVSSGALTSEVITVTMSGNIDCGLLFAAGIAGTGAPATPNDPNVSLPSSGTSVSAPVSATYSTDAADDLLVAFFCTANSVGLTAPSGWTKVQGFANTHGTVRFCTAVFFDKSVSATQTSQTFTSVANGTNNCLIVDAFTADILVVDVDATRVTSTGGPHGVGIEVDVTAPAASSAGVAHDVAIATTGAVTASKAASSGIARDVSLTIDSNVAAAKASGAGTPHAVTIEVAVTAAAASAAGLPHEVTPHAPPFTYLAVETIMRDQPVAAFGAMNNTPVAVIGAIPADGIVPRSVAVAAPQASAAGRAIAVGVSRAVRVTAPAASAAGVARNCLAA